MNSHTISPQVAYQIRTYDFRLLLPTRRFSPVLPAFCHNLFVYDDGTVWQNVSIFEQPLKTPNAQNTGRVWQLSNACQGVPAIGSRGRPGDRPLWMDFLTVFEGVEISVARLSVVGAICVDCQSIACTDFVS